MCVVVRCTLQPHTTRQAAYKADDEEVVKRRAETAKLEDELDELKTCVHAVRWGGRLAIVYAALTRCASCWFWAAGTNGCPWVSSTRRFQSLGTQTATAQAYSVRLRVYTQWHRYLPWW